MVLPSSFDVSVTCPRGGIGPFATVSDLPTPITVDAALAACEQQRQVLTATGGAPGCLASSPAGEPVFTAIGFSEGDTQALCYLIAYPACPATYVPLQLEQYPDSLRTSAINLCGCVAPTAVA